MKIIYNTNFLSKEEVEKIKYDNNDIELIGRDLTPDTPQGDLFHSICLLIINFVSELSQGLITNYIKRHITIQNKSVYIGEIQQVGKL